MIGKNLTLFIVSNDKKGFFKEVRISKTRLRYGLAGIMVFCLLLGVFTVDYFFSFSSRLNYHKYQVENKNLKTRLSQMHRKMESLNFRLNQIEDFSHKIKVIAGLKNVSSSPLAIGPLSHGSSLDLSVTSHLKPGSTYDSRRETASLPSQSDSPAFSSISEDSIVIYMDRLDKKSQLVRADIATLMERLYEKQDIMRSTPSILPASGWISSHFGYRKYPFTGEISLHEGIDIAAFSGTPVYAPADGLVVFAGYRQGYGKVIVIDHGYELATLYGHLSDIMVSRWQKTKRGEVIGTIGNTGNSSGPHLHYEIRISKVPVDPANYILNIPVKKGIL